jgi:hypothetical protein
MRHATSLLYHIWAVASRIRFASCGTSGKLTLWTCLVSSGLASSGFSISVQLHIVSGHHVFKIVVDGNCYAFIFIVSVCNMCSRLCDHHFDLVVRVPGHRSRGPGSIPGATTFSEK